MAIAEITHPKTKETVSYYIDDRMKKVLDQKVKLGLEKKDKDYIICVDGKEGCLSFDTMIKTTDGDKQIKDLDDGKSFFVESLDIKNDKKEVCKAICINTGFQEVFEIETEDGRKVKATKNHTFFVIRDGKVFEVKLSDLKDGDELICE